jgi:hypothetical protein
MRDEFPPPDVVIHPASWPGPGCTEILVAAKCRQMNARAEQGVALFFAHDRSPLGPLT